MVFGALGDKVRMFFSNPGIIPAEGKCRWPWRFLDGDLTAFRGMLESRVDGRVKVR